MKALCTISPFWFAIVLFVLLIPVSFAQGLTEAINLPEGIVATGDTTEVRALTIWAEENLYRYPEHAEHMAQRALLLAQNLNDLRGMGESSMILGHLTSDLAQREAYYMDAQEALEHLGDERTLASNQINFGNVAKARGGLTEALAYYFKALEEFERLGDTNGQASVLNNIGFLHQGQENMEEAFMYYQRATTLAETLNRPILLANILNNWGFALVEYGEYEHAENRLLQALTLSEEGGSLLFTAGISNNLGFLFNQQGQYEHALPYLYTAERLAIEMEEDGLLFAVTDEIGKAYMGLGQYDNALHYANESLTLAVNAESHTQRMHAHEALAQIYAAIEDYERAFFHQQQFTQAKDQVFSTERTEIIMEMQTRYETEEKRRTIEHLEQQNQIQTLRQTLLIVSIAGLLLILGFLYYRYRVKQRANRLLEELDIAKSRFFANISHEFRTPLTVILGSMQDALSGRFDGNTQKLTEQHQIIRRNARQLQRLIDEVLDLNRLEAGKLELQATHGDLVYFLREIIQINAPIAERNGIDLTFNPDVRTCLRLYDEGKLEKIVGNLLSNALKFTPRGGTVSLQLRCGNDVEISVADTGPGIPVDAQERVFDRFVQVETGALYGGTGIGLALAKELTELHGGAITLRSTPGEGSTFIVRFPLEEALLSNLTEPLAVADRQGAPQQQTATTSALTDRTTVLIIEDNDDIRAYIRRSLEETYRVIEAADGEDGLQKARNDLPDLIVSDVMLPGIDGYEIARALKAAPETECIPMVMLTARVAVEDQTEGYGSGAEIYLTKPFSAETLLAAVARLLEERQRLLKRLLEQYHITPPDTTHQDSSPQTLRTRARNALLEHLHDAVFGIDDLASALGMSRPTLYRRVKGELGITPNNFIQNLRLEYAHELLDNGAGSVSEVAYAVGFKSLSHFTRSFREHYGQLPSSMIATQGTRSES